MQIVIDVPEEVYQHMTGNDLLKSVHGNICYKAVCNGTPIPDNATNGDVIKAMFPYCKYNEYFADVEMRTEENDTRFKSVFDRDWWDEPYQKGGK